jgi:antitoxin component YwqK of YwqJK toxin-antitoxin module
VENNRVAAKGAYKDKYLKVEEGDFHSYYKTGVKWIDRSYIDGKKEGFEIFYHKNGNTWTKREYSNGRLLNILSLLDENGDSIDFGSLKDGEGKLFVYDESGNKTGEKYYKNGYLQHKESNINLGEAPVSTHKRIEN